MNHINVEIKARCIDQDAIRQYLQTKGDFKGTDHQIDTYFKIPDGRLKLREGNIENSLIFYKRNDQEGPKQSDVSLFHTEPGSALKGLLVQSIGVLAVVDKKREIYFIDNVKFHLDTVEGLGTFMEIEAIDEDGTIGKEKLLEQCNFYMKEFGIRQEDLVSVSYSDLILGK